MVRSHRGEIDDLGLQPAVRDREPAHGYRQIEATRSRASGIEIEYAVFRFDLRPVRMSADDGMKTCRDRLQVQIVQIVQDIDAMLLDVDKLPPPPVPRRRSRWRDAPPDAHR